MIPPRLHVFLTFMTQFIIAIAALGGVVPALHARGVHLAVLVPATVAGLVLLHLMIATVGKLLPVWCRECQMRFDLVA